MQSLRGQQQSFDYPQQAEFPQFTLMVQFKFPVERIFKDQVIQSQVLVNLVIRLPQLWHKHPFSAPGATAITKITQIPAGVDVH